MLSFVSIFVFMMMQSQNPLEDFRWKNRILIVSADEKSAAMLQTQIEKFKSEKADFADRKLLVFTLNETSGKTPDRKNLDKNSINAIRKSYDIPQLGFHLVLVGLDGGAKQSWTKPVLPTEIYRLIDAMPMRQKDR